MRAFFRVRRLTDEQPSNLQKMTRRRTLCAGRVKRARIILLSNQGYTHQDIATKLEVSYHTSCRWIVRFNELGRSWAAPGGPTCILTRMLASSFSRR